MVKEFWLKNAEATEMHQRPVQPMLKEWHPNTPFYLLLPTMSVMLPHAMNRESLPAWEEYVIAGDTSYST